MARKSKRKKSTAKHRKSAHRRRKRNPESFSAWKKAAGGGRKRKVLQSGSYPTAGEVGKAHSAAKKQESAYKHAALGTAAKSKARDSWLKAKKQLAALEKDRDTNLRDMKAMIEDGASISKSGGKMAKRRRKNRAGKARKSGRKKRRSAAQVRATKKLVALMKKKRKGGAPKKRRRKSRKAASSGTTRRRRRKSRKNPSMWKIKTNPSSYSIIKRNPKRRRKHRRSRRNPSDHMWTIPAAKNARRRKHSKRRKHSRSGRSRRNPMGKFSPEKLTGLKTEQVLALALGGAAVPVVNSVMAKIPGVSTVVGMINSALGPQVAGSAVPILAGIGLKLLAPKLPAGAARKYADLAAEGLVSAGVIGVTMSMSQQYLAPMVAGAMHGINFTPRSMAGINFTPKALAGGPMGAGVINAYRPSPADFGGYPNRGDFGGADFGHYDSGRGGIKPDYAQDKDVDEAGDDADLDDSSMSGEMG